MKWGARVMRVRSVSREEVWASAGVQGANCPPPLAPPKGFYINGFFVVARSLNVQSLLLVRQAQWQWRSTREGRARTYHLQAVEPRRQNRFSVAHGDPDASPTPEKVQAKSGGPHLKGEHVKDAVNAAFQEKGMLRRAATRTRALPRTRSTPNTSTHA